MVALRNVSKVYVQGVALHPTNLMVQQGSTTVLIGPSGCGKSTLLRLMIGLLKPSTGSIVFDQQNLEDQDIRAVRRRVGYVIQDGGLFPHLTAWENVTLMARHLGFDRAWIEHKAEALRTLTALPEACLTRYPVRLSGGERQRVSLMRALFLDPDLLLFDEPVGALDPMIRFGLQHDLKAIFGELKKTVVLVTHDMAEAAFFGDVIVLMRAGRVVQQGALDDLLGNPAEPFVGEFIRAQRGIVV